MQFAGTSFSYPLTRWQILQSLQDPNRSAFGIFHQVQGRGDVLIGYAEIYWRVHSFKLCRILIGEADARGKGYGESVVRQLLAIGFQEADKNFAELNVFDWNQSAIRCYEKVGFATHLDNAFESQINGQVWRGINMRVYRHKVSRRPI